jgi:probable phosphoglycerate mutase
LSPKREDDDGHDQEDDQDDPSSSSSAIDAAIVVTGFTPEECRFCRSELGLPLVAATEALLAAPLERQGPMAARELQAALARDAAAAEAGAEEDRDDATSSSSSSFFSSASTAAADNADDNNTTIAHRRRRAAALALGRTALFVGDPSFAAAYASSLNDTLMSSELWPCVVAAATPKHAQKPLREAVREIRDAHARRHGLVRPLAVDPSLAAIPPPGATLAMNLEIDASDAVPISTTAAAAVLTEHEEHEEQERGGKNGNGNSGNSSTTPPPVLTRRDASHVVVIDGLVTDAERAELMAALTFEGYDPSAPPPSDRWEAKLVDRAGEPPTWGLKAAAIRSLLRSPPRALVALQSRLAALYPEFELCLMPSRAMRGGGGEDDEEDDENHENNDGLGGGNEDDDDDDDEDFIAPLVANAVAPGDPCAWHVDADASLLPADAPFALQYGAYFNREPGLPLLVTIMIYLNDAWSDEYHAETLFLDPATGVGAFSSARPGRVVLQEQDVSHRIGAPSALRAPGLRYSLVLKTVWLPREEVLAGGGWDGRGISRAEWGEPQAIGSAARAIGPRGGEVVAAAAASPK